MKLEVIAFDVAMTKWELEQRERERFERIYYSEYVDNSGVFRRVKTGETPGEKETARILSGLAKLAQAIVAVENLPKL